MLTFKLQWKERTRPTYWSWHPLTSVDIVYHNNNNINSWAFEYSISFALTDHADIFCRNQHALAIKTCFRHSCRWCRLHQSKAQFVVDWKRLVSACLRCAVQAPCSHNGIDFRVEAYERVRQSLPTTFNPLFVHACLHAAWLGKRKADPHSLLLPSFVWTALPACD